ncbi:MAG: hypothetical protein ABSB89_09050 [Candidatus Bathyarchaeia archaeon]|jgi:hypothetical protein
MSNNQETGNKESLNVDETKKKQRDKHYNDPSYFNEVKADAYTPQDNAVTQDADMSQHPTIQTDIKSDDGNKQEQNPEEEYTEGDSYPIKEGKKRLQPKQPHKTLPFE